LRTVATAIFVIAIPIFLFGANLLWAVLDVGTYERAFFGYGAAQRTGLSAEELRAVAQSFATHFRDGTPIEMTVTKGGQQLPMFTERELVHMQDVHDLVARGLVAAAALLGYFILFAAAGRAWWRKRFVSTLAKHVQWGAGLTLAVLLLVAGLTLVNFDDLFWAFHVVSFPNDFWLLDPSQHYLINLFSQDFFLLTTLMVAGMTALQALVLLAVASAVKWRIHNGRVGQKSRVRGN
jgi:integral membrane protein (TIGR01906 family)